MSAFLSALWVENLKARRSKVPWLTALGFSLAPLMGGLFMIILKNPEKALSMGFIGAKARLLTAGVADWPTYFQLLIMSTAIGGALLFAIITAWVFGREFSDHTAKELLALPTPREVIVSAKFAIIAAWAAGLTVLIFAIGLGVGAAVSLPGWSTEIAWKVGGDLTTIAVLNIALMPPVALFASAGRGYLPPLGWAIFTLFLAQVLSMMGWASWFPWSVPAMLSQLAGPQAEQLGLHSYVSVALACAAGLAVTYAWWRNADQTE